MRAARNPDPAGSLGYVGRTVRVAAPARGGDCIAATLLIPLAAARLGTVDPRTLRLFRWDKQRRTHVLLPASALGRDGTYVFARVTQPGTYTLIGINAHPVVAHALITLTQLAPWLRVAPPVAAPPRRGSSSR